MTRTPEEKIKWYLDDLSDALEFMEKANPKQLANSFSSLAGGNLWNLASCYLPVDPATSIRYYYKSALTIQLLFDIHRGDAYPQLRLDVREIDYFPLDKLYECVLNCHDPAQFAPFVQNYLFRHELVRYKRRPEKIYQSMELYLALSHLILDDHEKFEFHVERSKLEKRPGASMRGYYEMLWAIAKKDASLFEEGAAAQLKACTRSIEYRDSGGKYMSYTVSGLINLAASRGLDCRMDHRFISPALITPLPAGFAYEGIPEVQKALERNINYHSGIMGKFKNLFNNN